MTYYVQPAHLLRGAKCVLHVSSGGTTTPNGCALATISYCGNGGYQHNVTSVLLQALRDEEHVRTMAAKWVKSLVRKIRRGPERRYRVGVAPPSAEEESCIIDFLTTRSS